MIRQPTDTDNDLEDNRNFFEVLRNTPPFLLVTIAMVGIICGVLWFAIGHYLISN